MYGYFKKVMKNIRTGTILKFYKFMVITVDRVAKHGC
jgi:hypothetical protein